MKSVQERQFALKRILFLCIFCWFSLGWSAASPSLPNGLHHAEINGTRLAFAVYGQGPACMVVANSWGLSHTSLRHLLKPLETRLTMIYFDPRGMGASAPVLVEEDVSMKRVREDLNALRQHLGLEKPHFLGWSNGAMNLLLFLVEYGEHVHSAVLAHGVAGFSAPQIKELVEQHGPFLERRAAFSREIEQLEGGEREKNLFLRNFMASEWFPYLCADRASGQSLLRPFFESGDFSWRHMKYQDRVDSQSYDARGLLGQIKLPVLVLAGRHDLMSPAVVEEIHRGVEGSLFHVFENSGHFAPLEEADQFQRVVWEFIAERENE